MARVYNFSAGPSMLPEPVLKQASLEMLDYEVPPVGDGDEPQIEGLRKDNK